MILYPLPTTIEVHGQEYPIQTNFRNWILFEELLGDDEIPNRFKFKKLLELVCLEFPEDLLATYEALLEFYLCGKKPTNSKGGGDIAYSFDEDSNLIFTAFFKTYGLDLENIEYLHWWKFKALFNDLNDDCLIVKIMDYRTKDISKIKNKEEKEFYRDMKKRYTLNKPTEKEQAMNEELLQALQNGGDVGKIVERMRNG